MILLPQLLLIIFLLVTLKSKELSLSKKLLFLGILITAPMFWQKIISANYLVWWMIVLFLWVINWKSKVLIIKIVSWLVVMIISSFMVLHDNGVLSNSVQIDKEKTFFVDNKFGDTISRFREQATYMYYRCRFAVWSSWVLVVDSIGRTLKYSGGEVLSPIIGIGFLILLIIGLFNKVNAWEIIALLIGILVLSFARNPNTVSLWWFWPPILKIAIDGLHRTKIRIIVLILFVNFVYLISP